MVATEGKPPLLTLPNELFSEVASHLESFKDLNSLLRTSRFFHDLFNTQLYRRAIAAEDAIRAGIAQWVLSEYRVASLTRLLNNGLSIDQKLPIQDGMARKGMVRGMVKEANCHMLHKICKLKDQKRSLPLAQVLLSRGADVNAEDKRGNTPLHYACNEFCDANTANLLIAHGADIEARDQKGNTPLLHALLQSCTPVIATLREHGADYFARGCLGLTPLHAASHRGLEEYAGWLLSHGADVNETDADGHTPLYWASAAHNNSGLSTGILLLENGADSSATDSFGLTPLHAAIFSGSDEVIRLLVARGANVSVLGGESRERVENLCSGERMRF